MVPLQQVLSARVIQEISHLDASLADAPKNAHVLPVPFGDADVKGDLLLFRVTQDDDAEPVDFTLAEYEAFRTADRFNVPGEAGEIRVSGVELCAGPPTCRRLPTEDV